MTVPDQPLRASDLLGRTALDAAGTPIGRVVDLVCEDDGRGHQRLTSVIVVSGRWGRLLGYDREQVDGPWLVEALARRILRRATTTVARSDLRVR
jgi:hypothetical protein